MSRIRGRNTSPEIKLRKALYEVGLRGYRVHYKISGKPDVVFLKKKIAIFIDGDFWHGYLWKKQKRIPPKEYWQQKIEKNITRDKEYTKQLKKEGWKVLRFWEHEIKKNPHRAINKIKEIMYKMP